MIILDYNGHPVLNERIIVIIGNGFVGSSIFETLIKNYNVDFQSFHLKWSEPVVLLDQLIFFFDLIKTKNPLQIDWIWSAGKAGFYSTEEQTKVEFETFSSVVSLLEDFRCRNNKINSVFHLVSSAGGLYEGQVNVGLNSRPLPLRPYGVLKLEQEEFVRCNFRGDYAIYRLSTVYGAAKKDQRKGLISVLIENTLNCRMTSIDARFDTIRDFVWVEDIAIFIVNKVLDKSNKCNNIYHLVSGKPTTIVEIINTIKKITNNTVLYSFIDKSKNNKQMSFSSKIIPVNWHQSSLESVVRKIYQQMQKQI